MTSRRRLSRAVIAGLAALASFSLLLTGCAGIPSSGTVQAGLPDLQQTEQQVLFSPGKPVPGATPEEIVRGFVEAGSSATDDYAIARQFLSGDYAPQWDPSTGVLVNEDGTRSYTGDEDEQVMMLSFSGIATVDSEGVLDPITPGPPTEVQFELDQEDGEWRISSAPTGVILERTKFLALWSPHQLYFGSADGVLVPDSRWFLRPSAISTQLVNALLAGPTESLIGTAVSGFPSGTVLTTESVPVVNGVAQIDLSAEFQTADPGARELVVEQLAASLYSVPGVTNFVVTVDQVEVVSGAVVTPQSAEGVVESEAVFSPEVMTTDGRFGTLTSNGFVANDALGDQLAQLAPTAITMSANQRAAAILNSDGAFWVTPEDIVQLDSRPRLFAPTVDHYGFIWTALRAGPETISVMQPSEPIASVAVPWLAGETVIDLRVSPEGHRLAALVESDGGTRVMVSGIIRDGNNVPIEVNDSPRTVLWASGTPIDFDWVDDHRVVALSANSGGARVTLGGPSPFPTEGGSVSDATSVRGGGTRSLIRVLDSDNNVIGPQGSGWQKQAAGYALLAKRG